MSFQFKDDPNPTGDVYEVDVVEERLTKLMEEWDEETKGEAAPWWQFWRWGSRIGLTKVTDFLIRALDQIINIVDDVIDVGPDKKATVLDAINRLYDYVAVQAIPIWLRPIAGTIKNYIVNTLISNAIDWIVEQYNNGSWKNKSGGVDGERS